MALSRVFLDTNGWLALLNSSDQLHPTADALWKDLGRRGYSVIVSDWIIAETGNGLARTAARTVFVQAVERLLTSSRARTVYVRQKLLDQALALYAGRPDKTWGLVDCATFVIMRQHRTTEAFTNDRHFEQAGFAPLLPNL